MMRTPPLVHDCQVIEWHRLRGQFVDLVARGFAFSAADAFGAVKEHPKAVGISRKMMCSTG
jgi:hypothetical protein